MSALKELRTTIAHAKSNGHKVISLAYVDKMLSLAIQHAKNATTDTLGALNGEVMTNEHSGHHPADRESNTK